MKSYFHLFLLTLILISVVKCLCAQTTNDIYSYTYQLPTPPTMGFGDKYMLPVNYEQLAPEEYEILKQLRLQLSLSEPIIDSIPHSITNIFGIKAPIDNQFTYDSLPKIYYWCETKEVPNKIYRILQNDRCSKYVVTPLILGSFYRSNSHYINVLHPDSAILKQYNLQEGETLGENEKWITSPSYILYYGYTQNFVPVTLYSETLTQMQMSYLLSRIIPQWQPQKHYPGPNCEVHSLIPDVLCEIYARGYSINLKDIESKKLSEKSQIALVQFQKDHNLPIGNLNIETLRYLGVKR